MYGCTCIAQSENMVIICIYMCMFVYFRFVSGWVFSVVFLSFVHREVYSRSFPVRGPGLAAPELNTC